MQNLEKQKIVNDSTNNIVVNPELFRKVFGVSDVEARALSGWLKEAQAGLAKIIPEKSTDGQMGGVGIYDLEGKRLYYNTNPKAMELLDEVLMVDPLYSKKNIKEH